MFEIGTTALVYAGRRHRVQAGRTGPPPPYIIQDGRSTLTLDRTRFSSLVEVRGFEPLASSVRGKRSAGLSYTPGSVKPNCGVGSSSSARLNRLETSGLADKNRKG